MRLRYSLNALLLAGEAGKAHAQTPQASVRGVVLGAGRRHRHPHRRMGLLVRLGQHRSARHREELAVVGETLFGPHLGDDTDELVPALFGVVDLGPKATEFGEGCRAPGAELETSARDDVECGRSFGDTDRVVELGDADDDAMAEPHRLGFHYTRREKDLGGGTVAVLLEEVMLDRPHLIEPELRGELDLLESVVVHGLLSLAVPRTRHGQLVENAEFHPFTPVIRVPGESGRRRHRAGSGRSRRPGSRRRGCLR